MLTFGASFFTSVPAGFGAGPSFFTSSLVYDPSGPEASPRCASTSPFVSIPRTPVPLIDDASAIPCACRRCNTEGKSGRACEGCVPCVSGVGVEELREDDGVGEGEEDASTELVLLEVEAVLSSFGISRFEMSSPSSARSAMSLPTGTFLLPSPSWRHVCHSG
jgi:hypothetical protein